MRTAAAKTRTGDIRAPRLLPILVGASAVVAVAVAYLTAYRNFWQDEWNFVWSRPPWRLDVLFLSHNEHWVTIPVIVWKVLFVIFGLRTHVPYEAALLVVHGATVLLLFTYIRRRSGDLPAFGAAMILLLLGSGGMDIVWAFQIGFVGSAAFGLLALLLIQGDPPFPSRLLPLSGALLGSLMCSGDGLAFVVAVGAQLLFDSRRRRFLLALVGPAIGFGFWFYFYGSGFPGTPGAPCAGCMHVGFSADVYRGPLSLGYLSQLAQFVAVGMEASLAAVAGLTGFGPILIWILAAILLVQWYWLERIETWQVGLIAGLVSWFALIGLGRSQTGSLLAADSHYVYIGAVFVLPILAHAARLLPWRSWWRPALVAALALALASNALQLRDIALSQTDVMRVENAELATAQAFRGAPDIALDRPLDPVIMPQMNARLLYIATDQLGSPVPPATVESLQHQPASAVDLEMLNLFGQALTFTAEHGEATAGLACRTITASTIDLAIPSGESFVLQSSAGGVAQFSLGYLVAPQAEFARSVSLGSNVPERVQLPDTGKPIVWRLRIQSATGGAMALCGDGVASA